MICVAASRMTCNPIIINAINVDPLHRVDRLRVEVDRSHPSCKPLRITQNPVNLLT